MAIPKVPAASTLLVLAAAFTSITSAQTTFTPRYTALNGGSAGFVSTVQADLNGDGTPDLIKGNGVPLAAGDFNADGKDDVLFYDFVGGSQLFYIGYGNGNGGFTYKAVPNIPGIVTGGQALIFGQTADINGDGRPDVVVAYYLNGYVYVRSYINNGSTFTLSGVLFSYKSPNGSIGGYTGDQTQPIDLLLGDFDSDGHADFALRVLAGPDQDNLWILYGDGQGHLASKAVYTNRNSQFIFNAANIDDDGYSDLIGGNNDGSIHIFRGSAGRRFVESTISAAFLQRTMYVTYPPVIADFDGNGWKDIAYIAYSTYGSNELGLRAVYQSPAHTWTLGDSTAEVDTFQTYFGDNPFYTLVAGDYTKDAKPDVILFSSGDANTHPDSADFLINTGTHAVGSCAAPAIGIHVCSPGASSASPVKFSFSATSFYPVRKMEVWVDGAKKSETYHVFANQGFSDVSLALSAGKHTVSFFSGTYDGGVTKKTITVTVP